MLREVVSAVGIAAWDEAALLFFVIAFVAVCARTHGMSKATADALATMAINDGVEPSPNTRHCSVANRMPQDVADADREFRRE